MDFTDNPFRWKRLSQATKKHERSQRSQRSQTVKEAKTGCQTKTWS